MHRNHNKNSKKFNQPHRRPLILKSFNCMNKFFKEKSYAEPRHHHLTHSVTKLWIKLTGANFHPETEISEKKPLEVNLMKNLHVNVVAEAKVNETGSSELPIKDSMVNFIKLKQLGSGGTSTVWLVVDQKSGEQFAMK